MKPTPTRDPQLWAAFNSRFARLLEGTPTLCFWLVVAGSVYGIQKSIESQHPGAGLAIALIVAWAVQSVNGVSVKFSTRMLAAGLVHIADRTNKPLSHNVHQRYAGLDTFLGIICLCLTAAICFFDFRSNVQAAEKAAHIIVDRPDSLTVSTADNDKAITAAQLAVTAAKAAEDAERRTYEAGVDQRINQRRAPLAQRAAHLQRVSEKWAQNELRAINSRLHSLETERAELRRAFIPKTSNFAGAQNDLARLSADNSRQILTKTAIADSTNTASRSAYMAKKDTFSMAIFWLYIVFMLLWHLCECMIQYRALRFDEQHPNTGSPLVAIAAAIRHGLANIAWGLHAKILDWMPEDEIHGITRPELIARTNTDICHSVFQFLLQNQGVNEMLIYTAFRGKHDPSEVRQALRLLKTAKIAFENSGIWHADHTQAQFFTAQTAPYGLFSTATF